jgi:hypothetical protein
MALVLPRAAEREYLTLYGLAAVYVAALASGPTMVGTSRDLLQSLISIRRRFRTAVIVGAYWTKDETEAKLIAAEVNRSIAHGEEGLLVANAKTAARRVEDVAAQMNLQLVPHGTILYRVREAVTFIEQKIAEAQLNGDLREFNRQFRKWRLEALKQGRTMSYREARARLRRALYKQILADSGMQIFPTLDVRES